MPISFFTIILLLVITAYPLLFLILSSILNMECALSLNFAAPLLAKIFVFQMLVLLDSNYQNSL